VSPLNAPSSVIKIGEAVSFDPQRKAEAEWQMRLGAHCCNKELPLLNTIMESVRRMAKAFQLICREQRIILNCGRSITGIAQNNYRLCLPKGKGALFRFKQYNKLTADQSDAGVQYQYGLALPDVTSLTLSRKSNRPTFALSAVLREGQGMVRDLTEAAVFLDWPPITALSTQATAHLKFVALSGK
jgi:hypothetical protein